MIRATPEDRRRLTSLCSMELELHQLGRLNKLLDAVLPANTFYAGKLSQFPRPLKSLDELAQFPFTFKSELQGGRQPHDTAANLTWHPDRYVHYHQTSGTKGRPLVVLDTAEDWQWWIEGWQFVFDAAGVTSRDRVFMAFSFGPFIGFWSAYEAAGARGCMVIPSGGRSTLERLEMMRHCGASVVCCTPSYAWHLAEVAAANGIRAAELPVEKFVVAGEPGGSALGVRQPLEELWQAKVYDHAGATEVGPWGFPDRERTGLHVNESEFIAEFLSVEDGSPAKSGELSELVLTGLGRYGCPVIRYRTGDLVCPTWPRDGACRFVLLEGGVLGRADDMLTIRGVNVFPTAVEQILRSFPEVVEYRMIVRRVSRLDELEIEIEDRLDEPGRVADELRLRLGLRIAVRCVPPGSLPRAEGKGRRLVDLRHKTPAGGN